MSHSAAASADDGSGIARLLHPTFGRGSGRPAAGDAAQSSVTSDTDIGIETFGLDAFANLTGDFNSLLLVPLFVGLGFAIALLCMGNCSFRCFPRMDDGEHEKKPRIKRAGSQLKTDLQSQPWICGMKTFLSMFTFSEEAFESVSKNEQVSKYEWLALVSALFLGIVTDKLTYLDDTVPELDRHLYGILWCSATYAFFASTVSSAMFIFAYGQCRDNVEARFWTRHMGIFALRLPMLSAGLGFLIFILGTTHLYIIAFRRGEGHDFAVCAACCYVVIPITGFALFKVHHGLHVLRRGNGAVKEMKPLEYEDIDNLFRDYVRYEAHLDVGLDDFLEYANGRAVVRDGIQRACVLRGLRRAYAETLVQVFHGLEMESQKPCATAAASKLFEELSSRSGRQSTHSRCSTGLGFSMVASAENVVLGKSDSGETAGLLEPSALNAAQTCSASSARMQCTREQIARPPPSCRHESDALVAENSKELDWIVADLLTSLQSCVLKFEGQFNESTSNNAGEVLLRKASSKVAAEDHLAGEFDAIRQLEALRVHPVNPTQKGHDPRSLLSPAMTFS